jgi:hypothetical protein
VETKNVIPSTNDFETVSYDSVSVFLDGGKDYIYVIDGVENHYLVPPDGFTPLTATDDELERYCFPARPDIFSDDYAEWETLMANYRETPDPIIKTKRVSLDRVSLDKEVLSTSASSVMATSTTRYSRIWSGYESNLGSSSATFYNQVQMDYIHPTISSTSGSCYNSYWVGLGGRNSGKLVQAGTATSGSSTHVAWYEYLSDTASSVSMQIISSLTINAGDNIHVYISFQKANNKFEYYIANNTTGQSAAAYVTLASSDYLDGTTAEWIVERCTNGSTGLPYNLGNYGTITLTTCKATLSTSSTWLNLGSLSGLYNIIMKSNGASSGTTLSTPGSISSSNTQFSCTWNNYS